MSKQSLPSQAASRVVIVGGGQAAAQLVGRLRSHGFSGHIVLFCAERMLPYQRPPLSKKFLMGALEQDKLLIRKQAYYIGHEVDVRVGCPVLKIDSAARQVVDDNHQTTDYDVLVLATGGRPRSLPMIAAGKPGVHYLRSVNDTLALREQVRDGLRVILLGGGYIGLETAASLRSMGCQVQVLEMQSRVLERTVAPQISQRLFEEHQRQGSQIRCNLGVAGIVGDQRFEGVVTNGGEHIEADLLLVGVGMQANTALAEQAGLECDDGILVDGLGRTSSPDIYAIGDVARPRLSNGLGGARLESVDNAVQSANRAAAAIAGSTVPAKTTPWFWSDQYTNKLQMVGLAPGSATWLERVSLDGQRLSCFCVEDGRLRAAQCLNAAGDFMVAKRLIASAQTLDPAMLTNPSIALRDLVTQASE